MKRINFFTFLDTDAPEWQTEQAYHRTRALAHNKEAHGHGIVRGFAAGPTTPASLTVVIAPGYALDSEGHELEITVTAEISLASFVPGTGEQMVYIVAEHMEAESDPVFIDELGINKNKYIDETTEIKAQTTVPILPQIELARVNLGAGATSITAPVNPMAPGVNEIDSRAVRYARAGDRLAVMFRGTVAPLTPEEGDLWYDMTNHTLKVWNGTTWQTV